MGDRFLSLHAQRRALRLGQAGGASYAGARGASGFATWTCGPAPSKLHGRTRSVRLYNLDERAERAAWVLLGRRALRLGRAGRVS
eukprot:260128-Chlamydomonas_euryale.AAC.1